MATGGAERVTATLANHWARQGWQISIVTIAGVDGDAYALDPAIRRWSLNLESDSQGIAAALVNNCRRIAALRRMLRELRPDAAISMMSTANCILALARRGLDIVAVGSERIHPPRMPLGRAWELARKISYPTLDCIVVQTEMTSDWMGLNMPAVRLAVIPNPVALPLEPREPLRHPDEALAKVGNTRVLLAVGRLEPQKGFDRLIKAFSECSWNNDNWVLVILGEGSERGRLEQAAAMHGIADRVFMPGAVGNVADWYRAADFFALTSRYEGFPNCLVEAMAHGLAAVAVDCETGPADIVRHEVDALLIPGDDDVGLQLALQRMMASQSLRQEFGARAAEVRQRYAVASVAAKWEQQLQCAVNK